LKPGQGKTAKTPRISDDSEEKESAHANTQNEKLKQKTGKKKPGSFGPRKQNEGRGGGGKWGERKKKNAPRGEDPSPFLCGPGGQMGVGGPSVERETEKGDFGSQK